MLENYLDQKDIATLEQLDDYILEQGIPVAIANDPTKFVSLSEYAKFNLQLINISYNVELQLKRTALKLERETAERCSELKQDGISSAAARKEALLSGSSVSTTKLLELQNSVNELEAIKWKLVNKQNLITNILRLY